jgi:peptide/nickel transport system substrate-binding protein
MKKTFFLLFFISCFFAFLGCNENKTRHAQPELTEVFPGVVDRSKSSLTRGTRGGSFIRADIEKLDSLNIVTTRSRSVHAVLTLVFDSLISIHPVTGELQGGLAKNFEIINNEYSLVFNLNENVRFSDGALCTSDDVLFTFEEIYMNPDVDTKLTDALKIRDQLISIEKIDQFTLKFDLPVPYRPFLYTLTFIKVLPKHIIEPLIENKGVEAFNRDWGNINGDLSDIIGTGPYYIKELEIDNQLKLARNPFYNKREGSLYFDEMPYFDEIIELLELDNESKLLKFQIGEIDFFNITDTDIASGDFETLLTTKTEGNYQLYSGGHTLRSNHFLVFNQKPRKPDDEITEIFQNPLFRRAASLLIDKQSIVDEIYKGYAYIDSSPERSPSPYYKKKESLGFDPETAAKLLSRIPLVDMDGDGFRDLPSGKPFHFTIFTNDDNPFRIKMGEAIIESYKKAGINADLSAIDYDLIVTKFIDTFEWDAVILGIDASIEPNESSWIWESKGKLHLWNPYQEKPASIWEKRIDELFALGRTTWDSETAGEYYNEYQDIISVELPVINILVPAELYGFRNGFGNVVPSAVSYNSIGLMPYIYVKKSGRSKNTFLDLKTNK